jgi:hypothetical protein
VRQLLHGVAHDKVAVGARGRVRRDARASLLVHAADGAEEGADLLGVAHRRLGGDAGRRGHHVLAQRRVGRRGKGLGCLPEALGHGRAAAGHVGGRVRVHVDARVGRVGCGGLDGGCEGLEVLSGRDGRAGQVDETCIWWV